MLEQWQADTLLHAPKLYSVSTAIDLYPGADDDYGLEDADSTEFFLFDVRRSKRNPAKARFQLRYQRDIVIARLCTSVPHTNPDGSVLGAPHLHHYQAPDADRWAEELEPFETVEASLLGFCQTINLPAPDIQGGIL